MRYRINFARRTRRDRAKERTFTILWVLAIVALSAFLLYGIRSYISLQAETTSISEKANQIRLANEKARAVQKGFTSEAKEKKFKDLTAQLKVFISPRLLTTSFLNEIESLTPRSVALRNIDFDVVNRNFSSTAESLSYNDGPKLLESLGNSRFIANIQLSRKGISKQDDDIRLFDYDIRGTVR